MNREEYFQFARRFTNEMMAISKRKNQDYCGPGDNPFANFTKVEALGVCSAEVGFLTRMTDKISRIASFANNQELLVKDESVTDTLMDLANYCVLFAGYLERKKFEKEIEALRKGMTIEQVCRENDFNAGKMPSPPPRSTPMPTDDYLENNFIESMERSAAKAEKEAYLMRNQCAFTPDSTLRR